jgi:hypothetical protein
MGHTHNDQFYSIRSVVDGRPIGTVFAVPSMTTFVDLNPSFRVYEVDDQSFQILDFVQYRLDMAKANLDKTKLRGFGVKGFLKQHKFKGQFLILYNFFY